MPDTALKDRAVFCEDIINLAGSQTIPGKTGHTIYTVPEARFLIVTSAYVPSAALELRKGTTVLASAGHLGHIGTYGFPQILAGGGAHTAFSFSPGSTVKLYNIGSAPQVARWTIVGFLVRP